MALNTAKADAVAATIAAAVTGLSDPEKQDPTAIWKAVCRALYAALKTDIQVASGIAVTTTGGSGTTTGVGTVL